MSAPTPEPCQQLQNITKKGLPKEIVKNVKRESIGNCESALDEQEAATKIQAAFRGHQMRQSMKQPATKGNETSTAQGHHQEDPQEPTREQLEEEFRSDDAGKGNISV